MKTTPFFRNLSRNSMLIFFVSFALCLILISATINNRSNVERLTMEQIILEKSITISDAISKLLYKTQGLSALVIQANGEITDFERVAATIADDPSILNVLIAPGGVVSNVYPLEGNEAVIGLDFFSDKSGNKEARLAKETGELVFGGPFDLVQGGQALVGRLPVYFESQNGEQVFWGIVSVTLKYPQVLDRVGLALLEQQDFAYELWRINPDDGQKQIIAHSDYDYNRNARFIEKQIPILNAVWYFRISPVRVWYEYPEMWLLTLAALLISFMVAYVWQSNSVLKSLKSELEILARLDSLTGIHNRRYFMELANIELEKSKRTGGQNYIMLFDLDFFKQMNDDHGHLAGDEILKAAAQRIKVSLRSYDLFARFGGEEFIILALNVDESSAMNLAERMRKRLMETPVEYDGKSLSFSASFGIAALSPSYSLDETIKHADEALYQAKNSGRNMSFLYDADVKAALKTPEQ